MLTSSPARHYSTVRSFISSQEHFFISAGPREMNCGKRAGCATFPMKNVLSVAGIFGVSIVSVSSDLRILHQQCYWQTFHREAFCLWGASRRGATLVAPPGLMPSATSPLCRFKTRQSSFFQKKNAEEEGQTPNPDETVASIVEQTTTVLSTPIFEGTLNRPLALGYPLALLLGILILPFSTSVLFAIGFGVFAWIGRSAIDQDEENDEGEVSLSSDFLALVAAGLTAGILAPLSESVVPFVSIDNLQLFFVAVGASIVLALPNITNSKSSIGPTSSQDFIDKDNDDDELSISANEKRMMRLWDQAFSKVTTVRDSKRDEADK